ncbi:MAG: slipin family protein [Spirochaetaceae bacterium]|jgi:regulator of protease activity HflC (stomatin/prohibitin superfamily)|nr:slipin family protein [Spirochaetaceae bacterium]
MKPEEPKKKSSEQKLRRKKPGDFTLNAAGIALAVLGLLFITGTLAVRGQRPSLPEIGLFLITPAAVTISGFFFPRWSAALKIAIAANGLFGFFLLPQYTLAILFGSLAAFIAPAIQRVEEWERAVVLRFGRFLGVRGPGLFALIPIADRVAEIVDIRIRVTDFSAQKTLTLDSVTVDVDALCFWLVWDPKKSALEVQNYENAVILSSKTALRSAISRHDLTLFLERGDIIEKELQNQVDKKTTEWGITVLHIEITDIQIPEALQDPLSRLAQAEREKKSRILLAEAEIEIAKKLEEAVRIYAEHEPALKLKILSILNEGLKAGNSMMLVPNHITEELNSQDIFGIQALSELRRDKRDKKEEKP